MTRSVSMGQALLFQSCIKNMLCGIENRVFKESTELLSFQLGCDRHGILFSPRKIPPLWESRISIQLPYAIQHPVQPAVLSILLPSRQIGYCWAVTTGDLQIFLLFMFCSLQEHLPSLSHLFQGQTFKKALALISLYRIVMVILTNNFKIKLSNM